MRSSSRPTDLVMLSSTIVRGASCPCFIKSRSSRSSRTGAALERVAVLQPHELAHRFKLGELGSEADAVSISTRPET
jgi:hypothetical protein